MRDRGGRVSMASWRGHSRISKLFLLDCVRLATRFVPWWVKKRMQHFCWIIVGDVTKTKQKNKENMRQGCCEFSLLLDFSLLMFFFRAGSATVPREARRPWQAGSVRLSCRPFMRLHESVGNATSVWLLETKLLLRVNPTPQFRPGRVSPTAAGEKK